MRGPLALMLLACALAAGACGTATAPRAATDGVVVPHLKGTQLRPAICRLARVGLRWRFRGDRHVYSRPVPACGDTSTGTSMDDIPVTGQTPRAGRRVRRGTVVVIDDLCTDAARSGKGACA